LVILALPFRTNCEIVGIISFTLIIVIKLPSLFFRVCKGMNKN